MSNETTYEEELLDYIELPNRVDDPEMAEKVRRFQRKILELAREGENEKITLVLEFLEKAEKSQGIK